MMIIYDAIAVGSLVLLIGNLLLWLKRRRADTIEGVVPIVNMNEIKALRDTSVEPKVSNVKDRVMLEDKVKQTQVEIFDTSNKHESEISLSAIELDRLRRMNKELNEALAKEVTCRTQDSVSQQEYNRIIRTKDLLQKEVGRYKDEMVMMKQEWDKALEVERRQVQQLTAQVKVLKVTAQSLTDELHQHSAAEALTVLHQEYQEAGNLLDQFKEELDQYGLQQKKSDHSMVDAMQQSYQSSEQRVKLALQQQALEMISLKEELQQVKALYQEQQDEDQQTIQQLRDQISVSKAPAHVLGSLTPKMQGLVTREAQQHLVIIQGLTQEKEHLVQSQDTMKHDMQKAHRVNQQLKEREQRLQYELTKNRAQAMGLKKMCEDFKDQIEKLTQLAHQADAAKIGISV